MFHSINTKNRASKIHERALKLAYNDSPYLSFDELLIKDKSVSIHQRNLHFMTTEIFKIMNGVSTGLPEDIFQFDNKHYDFRYDRILLTKRSRTVFLWNRKAFFLGSKNLRTKDQNETATVAALACNFIKKETPAQVFSCEFCEISKNTFSYRTPPVAAFVILKINRLKIKKPTLDQKVEKDFDRLLALYNQCVYLNLKINFKILIACLKYLKRNLILAFEYAH